MDFITDTVVWLVDTTSKLVLESGRWFFYRATWLIDWSGQKVVNSLRLVARVLEWSIDNPWKAAMNLAIVIGVVLLVLAIEIYVYDLFKRRGAASGE